MNHSIGIIGGSDGPTAVIVASSPVTNWLVGGLILILAVGILFAILRRKKK